MLSNSKLNLPSERGAAVVLCVSLGWYAHSMKAIPVFLAWLGLVSAFVSPHVPGPRFAVRCASSTSSTSSSGDVQFRGALDKEEGTIRRILAGMLMNPLSIKVQNFICAEDEGALVGFGQASACVSVWYCVLLHQSVLWRIVLEPIPSTAWFSTGIACTNTAFLSKTKCSCYTEYPV